MGLRMSLPSWHPRYRGKLLHCNQSKSFARMIHCVCDRLHGPPWAVERGDTGDLRKLRAAPCDRRIRSSLFYCLFACFLCSLLPSHTPCSLAGPAVQCTTERFAAHNSSVKLSVSLLTHSRSGRHEPAAAPCMQVDGGTQHGWAAGRTAGLHFRHRCARTVDASNTVTLACTRLTRLLLATASPQDRSHSGCMQAAAAAAGEAQCLPA